MDTPLFNPDIDFQASFHTMATAPRSFPRKELLDLQGRPVNVEQLASDYSLILITLKRADCPACQQLLHYLNLYGLDADMTEYYDPFLNETLSIDPEQKKFCELLLKRDAYFIIVCPGSTEQVAEVQQNTYFMQYPFIGGEQAIELGQELKLQMTETQLWPAVLAITKKTLKTEFIKLGRGPADMSHLEVIRHLSTRRIEIESAGSTKVDDAHKMMEKLKWRAKRCREGRMVTTLSLLQPQPPPSPSPPSRPTQNSHWTSLPTEIVELMLSYLDTPFLLKASRTCRLFYISSCNVLIERLREHAQRVQRVLPRKDGLFLPRSTMDRLVVNPNAVGFRETEYYVGELTRLYAEVAGDTSPRIRRTAGWKLGKPFPATVVR
ncbi:predicted protein [Lichtheimia corymbifera JMRC:FSU:9682]|uniref:F-box domain-containing protein n=1 Tax=Lichtheimia corymbifera JMRC:FSU:9682 TaxID=1263082 RepID=A0A068RFC8_9FUNG|nr:predicted protein [Lichtheimia corymbifera JMRC:FSU:9682]